MNQKKTSRSTLSREANRFASAFFSPVIALAISGCSPSPLAERSSTRVSPSHFLSAADHTEAQTDDAGPDRLFADADSLAPNVLVDAVLKRNPTIEAARQAWEAARRRITQATSLEDPMLSYGLAPGTLGNNQIDDGHRIELSQRFPWPGKLRLRGEIAQRQAESASHDIETVRQGLIVETINAFYDYYYVHHAIDINDVNLELLREFQKIAETKYAAGTASKQDPLQAEVERYHLEHRAIVLERMRRVAQARINTLLHRPPELDLPPPLAQAAEPGARPELGALRERAVNERPELQALARRLEAKRAARELAAKEYLPDFTVMGTYNSMWDSEEHRWMIGAGINIPIQIDRRRSAELEALAQFNRLAAELVAGVDEVSLRVSETFDMLVESEQVVRLYRNKFMPVADENLKAARSGYESGANDFLTLLTAEKNLMLVQLARQQAITEYHQRWADLERAVGGDIPFQMLDDESQENPRIGDTDNE